VLVPDQSAANQSVPNTGPSIQGAPNPALAPQGVIAAPNGIPAAVTDQPQGTSNSQVTPSLPGATTFSPSRLPTVAGPPRETARQAPAESAAPVESAATNPKNPSRDLWSGFADGRNKSTDDVVTLPSSARSPMLPVGAAVLVGGLLSLVAGFGITEFRRRRITA